MSNQNIGIEVNGGGRNKITDAHVTVKGDGKGVVLNDSSDNELTNINVLFENEKQCFFALEKILNLIEDGTVNFNSNMLYKDETLAKVRTIINLTDRKSFQENTLSLVHLLSSWLTIKSSLAPDILPYINQLTNLVIGQ